MNKYVDGLAMLFSQYFFFFTVHGETATFWEVKDIEDDMLVETFSLQNTPKQI